MGRAPTAAEVGALSLEQLREVSLAAAELRRVTDDAMYERLRAAPAPAAVERSGEGSPGGS